MPGQWDERTLESQIATTVFFLLRPVDPSITRQSGNCWPRPSLESAVLNVITFCLRPPRGWRVQVDCTLRPTPIEFVDYCSATYEVREWTSIDAEMRHLDERTWLYRLGPPQLPKVNPSIAHLGKGIGRDQDGKAEQAADNNDRCRPGFQASQTPWEPGRPVGLHRHGVVWGNHEAYVGGATPHWRTEFVGFDFGPRPSTDCNQVTAYSSLFAPAAHQARDDHQTLRTDGGALLNEDDDSVVLVPRMSSVLRNTSTRVIYTQRMENPYVHVRPWV